MAKTEKEILELFKTAVFEVESKKLTNDLSPTTDLAALGLSSVSTMEVIGVMEERLEVQFPDEDLASIKTVGDLTRLVMKLGAK
jgi:acyl carrier protein